jgi:hypothetical protein
MVRKINKKSRRSISRRRRGAINKRTLRRNKSRVGGKLVPPSVIPFSNPQFKFTFNEKTYVIEKKRGFKMRDTKYNIFIFIDGKAQENENKNIDCESIISTLTILNEYNNEWLLFALETLIDDYNSTTSKGVNPENFEHFNELLLRMIEYFTENYITFQQSHPYKWYEFGRKIKEIINSEWCEKDKENILKLCGSKSVELNNDTLNKMYDDAASEKNAALNKAEAEEEAKYEAAIIEVLKANPAKYAETIICILNNIDSYTTICDQVYVNQLRQLINMDDSKSFRDILIVSPSSMDKFATICGSLLIILDTDETEKLDKLDKLIESIVSFTFKTQPLVLQNYIRTNNLYSKTLLFYLKINPQINEMCRLFETEVQRVKQIQINSVTTESIYEGLYKKVQPTSGIIPDIEVVRKEMDPNEQTFVSNIRESVYNIVTLLKNNLAKIPTLQKFASKYTTIIDNPKSKTFKDESIPPNERENYKNRINADLYLRNINPLSNIDKSIGRMISKVLLNTINKVSGTKPEIGNIIDISTIQVDIPDISKLTNSIVVSGSNP